MWERVPIDDIPDRWVALRAFEWSWAHNRGYERRFLSVPADVLQGTHCPLVEKIGEVYEEQLWPSLAVIIPGALFQAAWRRVFLLSVTGRAVPLSSEEQSARKVPWIRTTPEADAQPMKPRPSM